MSLSYQNNKDVNGVALEDTREEFSFIKASKICDLLTENTIEYLKVVSEDHSLGFFAFIWNALFFLIKDELSKNDIKKSVIYEFIDKTIGLFDVTENKEKTIECLIMQHQIIMDELDKARISKDTRDGILRIHQTTLVIAAELGTNDGEMLPSQSQERQFLVAAASVRKGAAEILYGGSSNYSQNTETPGRSQASSANVTRQSTKKQPAKSISSKPKIDWYVLTTLFLILGVFIAGRMIQKYTIPEPETMPTETQAVLVQKSRPLTGVLSSQGMSDGLAPFEITAPDDYDCLCILRSCTNPKKLVRIYLRAGRTYEVLVPLGPYELYHASGSKWYGIDHLFGEDTVYQKCDDIFRFTEDENGYSGWTVVLERVTNGNLDSDYIDAEDFPK